MSGAAKKNSNSSKYLIVIVLLVVLVVGLVGVVAFLLGRGSGGNSGAESGNAVREVSSTREVASSARMVLEESSSQGLMDQMREEVAEGMFACKMSMTWTFQDGTSESPDAFVANSESNTHPLLFDVYMRDTGELVYSSPVLPVGTELRNIKLDQALPAGNYKATVMYKLLDDVETQNEISSAGFVIKINVLN